MDGPCRDPMKFFGFLSEGRRCIAICLAGETLGEALRKTHGDAVVDDGDLVEVEIPPHKSEVWVATGTLTAVLESSHGNPVIRRHMADLFAFFIEYGVELRAGTR